MVSQKRETLTNKTPKPTSAGGPLGLSYFGNYGQLELQA